MSNFSSQCSHPLKDEAKFCTATEKTPYDVFLSYSHKDRDEFGMEYIERIKSEIEKALEPIITDHKPRVFLDAEALHLGDHWHSKIMESLNQCKAIVCLVSEAYLKSEYCTRERLWWNAKQTRAGHFLDGPYPVYFVKLEAGLFSDRREVKEMMSVQTDSLPWFEVKQKLQEEFIRERLKSIHHAVHQKMTAALNAQNFCSVLPPLYENFVGRVTELRELHEICVNGKYPVLQAAGGVGKTELSVAYAYGFADQYPMGRFLFRMERVTSWDEAFAKALEMNGTDAHGVTKKVFEELNIKKEDLERKDQGKLHEIAAKAFLERAAKGKLLILLDNLDGDTALLKKMRYFLCNSPIPGNIHILATTRGSFHFGVRTRFESYELKNLKEDEAFEMVCVTGNGLYPFDKQPPSAKNKEYQAAHEVIRLLDGHAWSMEIVSAFMAENYDPEGFNFAMELNALRKNTCLSTDFTYRAGEDSTTAVELLRPTLDKLATLELGAETLELAVFAACFDPDEIPLYLLKEYWDRNFPDAVCSEDITPYSYAVNLLAKYHLIRKDKDLCKMHRLVQAVFLMHKEKYLAKILKTLPKCSFIHPQYWIPLLQQTPALIDVCPKDGTLGVNEWIKLLLDPVLVAKCPWQSFSGVDWCRLLAFHPQFADRCDWDKLNGWLWMGLLCRNPQFADKCDWSKLDGRAWARLLRDQPQFADKCDWSRLHEDGWGGLLGKHPQFADRCNWSKLGGKNLAVLLAEQPQFADKCDWCKLNGDDWAYLLAYQPQFADKCDWNKLGGGDWSWLLRGQPQFADKSAWTKLDGGNWAVLLEKQPQFADKCDWSKLDGQAWARLLAKQTQFADKCDWCKLDGGNFASLLAEQPQFADKCDWSKLDGQAWAKLLKAHPEWYTKIHFSQLDSHDFADLLGVFPQLIKHFDLNEFDGKAWSDLLRKQPQFADQCDWSKLDGENWALLLGGLEFLDCQPQFADKCDWNKLDGSDWVYLLVKQPQFADKCDWNKLNGQYWAWLLDRQPQFADKCDWSKLDGEDWGGLLGKRPEFAGKCDLSKLSEEDRQMLLQDFPQLPLKKD